MTKALMKYGKIIFPGLGLLVIVLVIMRIMHVPVADSLLIYVLMAGGFYQAMYITILQKRLKALENTEDLPKEER